jgi:hypothetical protein
MQGEVAKEAGHQAALCRFQNSLLLLKDLNLESSINFKARHAAFLRVLNCGLPSFTLQDPSSHAVEIATRQSGRRS